MKASILPYLLIISYTQVAIAFLLANPRVQFFFSPSRKVCKDFSFGVEDIETDGRHLPRKYHYRYSTVIAAKHQGDSKKLRQSTLVSRNDWKEQPLPNLTLILPAFNEDSRIRGTIEKYRSYLEASPYWGVGKCECEILVVDDGSTDKTRRVVNEFAAEYSSSLPTRYDDAVTINYISLAQNEGKGAAVARGILEVEHRYLQQQSEDNNGRGWIILVADADGSGDLKSLDDMIGTLFSAILARLFPNHNEDSFQENHYSEKSVWHHPALVVGNRGYEGASVSRVITRWGFRTTVKLFCGDLNVSDTQCGFKLMTITAGSYLYSHLNLKRWSHDVEVLFRAKEMGIAVAETTIGWKDMEGSKLASTLGGTVKVSTIMLLEVLTMRLAYLLGRWKVPEKRLD